MSFFDPMGIKLENLVFLGQIFQTQTQTKKWLTRPKQQKFDPTRVMGLGPKNFDPDPSLPLCSA